MEISSFVTTVFSVNIRTSGWRRRAGVGVASTGTRGPHRLSISRAMARKQAPQTLKTFENHDLEQNFVENRSLDGITTLMATLAAEYRGKALFYWKSAKTSAMRSIRRRFSSFCNGFTLHNLKNTFLFRISRCGERMEAAWSIAGSCRRSEGLT